MKLTGKTVLIVDDDPEIKVLVKRILENVGFSVMEAESVKNAIRIIRESVPDLVILDLNMPEADGFVFLAFRKQNVQSGALGNFPVIVLSGESDPKAVQKAIGLGAANYLVKPLEAGLLIQRIRNVFYATDRFSYKVSESAIADITGFVDVTVAARNDYELQIQSLVRFDALSVLQLKVDCLQETVLKSITCMVENRAVNVRNDLYYQFFSLVGLSEEEFEVFAQWR